MGCPVEAGRGQVEYDGFATRLVIGASDTRDAFAVVEHGLEPRTLAAPVHEHAREDEYTIVLEGRIEAQLGDDVVTAGAGDSIPKPRGVPHTFWNPCDAPARVLEVIAPAGFERFFFDLADVLADDPRLRPLRQLCRRYGVDMRFGTLPELLAEHELVQAPGAAVDLLGVG